MTDETNHKLNGFLEAAKGFSRNPLGIIGLFQVLVYAIAGLVATFGNSFTPFQRDALTVFLVGFPPTILGVFAWLVSRHSGKLFAPSDYRDDANYLQVVQAAAVTMTAAKLQPGTPEATVQLAIASAERKTLPAEDTAETETEVSPKDELLKPQAHWKRTDYAWAYVVAIRIDRKNAEAISDAYLRTEQAGEDANADSWRAFRLGALIRFTNEGNLDNFDQLKRLAELKPLIPEVQEQLAYSYTHYDDFENAAGIFRRAASHTVDAEERSRLLGRAAFCSAKAGNPRQAKQIIEEIKRGLGGGPNANLINAIREVAEIDEDNDTLIAVLERAIADNPSDSDARFSLAFKHSARGNHDIALIHYLRIPPGERTAIAWNNLGVELNQFYRRAKAKAVDAFKTAEEMGETLAAANLASALIDAGFIDEARDRCVAAMKAENPHNHVREVLESITTVTGSEEEAVAEITQKARQSIDFYKELGKSLFLPNVGALADVWNGPQCELSVTLEGTHFTAIGSFESSGALSLAPAAPERFTIEYQGTIKGRIISGTVTRKSSKPPPPWLLGLSSNEPVSFQMVVADDSKELKAIEGHGTNRLFYIWRVKD